MDADAKVQQYLLLSKSTRGRGMAELIVKATAEPGLFTFGELLSLPAVQELQSTDMSPYHDLLSLFAYGTWSQYKASSSKLPQITIQHEAKLKQLTVVTIATTSKVIPYAELQTQLDIPEVRALEDFIITDCFYNNLIKGSLDQKGRCLHIHSFTGRDMPPNQLSTVLESLHNWASTSGSLLCSIEERMQQATVAAEHAQQHHKTVEAAVEDVKKSLTKQSEIDARCAADSMVVDDAYDLMEEERSVGRPKRWAL